MTKQNNGILQLRGLPPRLKNKMKAWCAERGITMAEGFIRAVNALLHQKKCEWCGGSGKKTHPEDHNPQNLCSLCDGSGAQSTKNLR